LADRAEVTVASVSRWLRGERNGPAGDRLRLILQAELPDQAAREVLDAIPAAEEQRAA